MNHRKPTIGLKVGQTSLFNGFGDFHFDNESLAALSLTIPR